MDGQTDRLFYYKPKTYPRPSLDFLLSLQIFLYDIGLKINSKNIYFTYKESLYCLLLYYKMEEDGDTDRKIHDHETLNQIH